jgi:hypothetical protein
MQVVHNSLAVARSIHYDVSYLFWGSFAEKPIANSKPEKWASMKTAEVIGLFRST